MSKKVEKPEAGKVELDNTLLTNTVKGWQKADKNRSADTVAAIDALIKSGGKDVSYAAVEAKINESFESDKDDSYRVYKQRAKAYAEMKIVHNWKGKTLTGAIAALKAIKPKSKPKKAEKSEAERIGEIVLAIATQHGWDFATTVAKISTLK